MDRQEMEPIVLARIPDLGSVGRNRHRGRSLASRGRVIGQALSFKLLAVVALVLVAMALVPLTVRKSSQSADSPPTPACTPVAQAPAPRRSVCRPLLQHPRLPVAPPTPAVAEIPLMSKWPNPAHPTSTPVAANEEPRAGANQPMAVRPPEYLRNNHDRTRSSIH